MQKHAYGYIISKVDYRDFRFVAPEMALPTSVDLRRLCSPILDQGQLGSCTCEALVAVMEFNQQPLITRSVLFPYYNTRLAEGTPNEDSGCEPRDVFKSAVMDGVCPNRYWPYSIKKFAKKPSTNSYKNAVYRIARYHSLAGLQEIKAWLAIGRPAYIGFTVYSSFEEDAVAATGVMPMPQSGEEVLGGHAVVVVGYDDGKGWLIVRNSWGKKWGVKGFFFMPYAFVTAANVSDRWGVVV